MTDVPADAPRSDDGQWWWDGSAWQPIPAAGVQPAADTGSQAAGGVSGSTAAGTATGVPADAPRSEDGQYWWDGSAWQSIPAAGGQPASDAGAPAAGAGGGDREAARVALGMPASLTDITDEQRKPYLGQPTTTLEDVNADQVEVVAMQDGGGASGDTGGQDGGATA